jgi:hypothetical protein
MRELPGDAPRGYLLVSVVLSDLPAFSITFRMNSYCVWTSRSAICIAESTISSRLDGPLAMRGQCLVNTFRELAHDIDRGALTCLNGAEHILGAVRGPVDRLVGRLTVARRRRVAGAGAAGLPLVVVWAIAVILSRSE